MAYEELLDWASKLLPWQQDALRRLAMSGELTDTDLTELQLQIEKYAGLTTEIVLEPVPLAKEHLNQAASKKPKTVLASLGPVSHVDRLSSNQPPIRFAVNGITLIYGANGSGKSGYCRIAKQLCQSQYSAELHDNVYDSNTPAVPQVDVAFRVGGDEESKVECVWFGNQEPPRELSRISVFDTTAARVYVDKKRQIEFLPYELDLMNKLGLTCRALDKCFGERLDVVNAAVNIRLPEGYSEGTTVQAVLASLVQKTAPTDLPSEQTLRKLGSWTAEHQAKIVATTEQLKQDPQVMILLRSRAKRALESVKEEISIIENDLADTALAAIRRKHQEAKAANRAAKAAAQDLFSGQPISELGSEI